jgi:formiminoglutamase
MNQPERISELEETIMLSELDRYNPLHTLEQWHGRVDSEDNYYAFRWHQCVKALDLTQKDLKPFDGPLGFAFLGFKSDEGIRRNKGRVGAVNGPASIRHELANLPCTFEPAVALFDAGDIICEDENLEESQRQLGLAVSRLLDLKLFPIVLGGGHAVAYGHYQGLVRHLEQDETPPRIGIFNFDAHFDLRPYPNGGSSGTMFKQIADMNAEKNLPFLYYCAGIQKYSNTLELFRTAESLGVRYKLARDLLKEDPWQISESIEAFIGDTDQLYVTICADVFSSAFAPGVSAPQPLGVDPELALKMLKLLLRSGKVISFDIAEVSPRFDQDNITASLAKVLIFTVVNTLCQNKHLLMAER